MDSVFPKMARNSPPPLATLEKLPNFAKIKNPPPSPVFFFALGAHVTFSKAQKLRWPFVLDLDLVGSTYLVALIFVASYRQITMSPILPLPGNRLR